MGFGGTNPLSKQSNDDSSCTAKLVMQWWFGEVSGISAGATVLIGALINGRKGALKEPGKER